jgi:hypothetical protein
MVAFVKRPPPGLLSCLLLMTLLGSGAAATNTPTKPERGYTYTRDVVPAAPWSIHILKLDRSVTNLDLYTALGAGTVQGMGTVSEQIQLMPAGVGRPVAAINGDFFYSAHSYPGDPIGLQISNGELVSAPEPTRVCCWLDAARQWHLTNVAPLFKATWPDGKAVAFGLNEDRGYDDAVLYTAAVGSTTRTRGGGEYVLEHGGSGPWLPLAPGQTYTARVREVRQVGNSPLTREILVLSLGGRLAARMPRLERGAILKLATATAPDLAGAKTGIGGGPGLVHGGKASSFTGIQFRHPRSAVGWNDQYVFLVVVDGRQSTSVGMTMPELAVYMSKLGCREALNFDGGGSATLWILGNAVNNPSTGYERAAVNALVLVQKPGPAK